MDTYLQYILYMLQTNFVPLRLYKYENKYLNKFIIYFQNSWSFL